MRRDDCFVQESGSDISSDLDMAWTAPHYTRGEVNSAGRTLVVDDGSMPLSKYENALAVINKDRKSVV